MNKKISVFLVFVLIMSLFVLADDSPTISLNGDLEVTLEVNTEYNEQGATAHDLEDGDLTSQIVINNNININVLGDYLVTYTVTDSANNTINITRLVHVVDTTNPTIIINGDSEVTTEVKNVYEDLGATASDNYDSELNFNTWNEVDTLVVGNYFVNYEAVDNSGNHGIATRIVHVVDTTRPEITLNGDSEINLFLTSPYEELGVFAYDNYDGNITNLIIITNNINISKLGDYEIVYQVSDSSGNSITVKRTVHVIDFIPPLLMLNGEYNISIEVFGNYTEEGATAWDDPEGEVTSSIIITNNINLSKLGVYEVIYEASDSSGNKVTEKRVVNVVDTTKPILTLNRADILTVYVEDGYEDDGATAQDNYDGDLTSSIVVNNTILSGKIGKYNITYTATDSSGNTATITRQVTYIFKPEVPSSNGGSGGGGGGGSSSIKKLVAINSSLNKTELKNPADLIQKVTKKQELIKKESSDIVKPKASKEMAITTIEGKDSYTIKDIPQAEKVEKKGLSLSGKRILASLLIGGLLGVLYYKLIHQRRNKEEENDEELN